MVLLQLPTVAYWAWPPYDHVVGEKDLKNKMNDALMNHSQ